MRDWSAGYRFETYRKRPDQRARRYPMGASVLRTLKLLGAMAMIIVVGCTGDIDVGPLERESRSVDLGEAESVRATISMSAGKLEIAGGADKLMEADFAYNVDEWKPVVRYRARGSIGNLTVKQPGMRSLKLGRGIRNQWNLKLNDGVPMDLNVELAAGSSRLELGSLSLRHLGIHAGAGEVEVDLTGNPSVRKIEIEAGAGDVRVDLTGHWEDDLHCDIEGGVGRVTVKLPADVGVRVDAEKGIGKVSAKGLMRLGGAYVNDAYRESDVTLYINAATGIGKINLEVAGYGTTI
jgi:hypothetical protein